MNLALNSVNNKYGVLVKRLRRSPLTAESGVRFPNTLPIGNLKLVLQVFFILPSIQTANALTGTANALTGAANALAGTTNVPTRISTAR